MRVFTIGFTKKSAEEFFNKLTENNVRRIVDIRLNNKSQLAGFTRSDDLKYFLRFHKIEYVYRPEFAPTKELLADYRKNKITWQEYENRYLKILSERNIVNQIDYSIFEDACLLCSEAAPDRCHRRLLVEFLQRNNPRVEIKHL
ncbi:MAG: DUF488 domain-containing protein [Candidatus Thermoplasmatota archaeon]